MALLSKFQEKHRASTGGWNGSLHSNKYVFYVVDYVILLSHVLHVADIPLIGCYFHKLNLAVGDLIGRQQKKNSRGAITQAEDGRRPALTKVDKLMGQLRQVVQPCQAYHV